MMGKSEKKKRVNSPEPLVFTIELYPNFAQVELPTGEKVLTEAGPKYVPSEDMLSSALRMLGVWERKREGETFSEASMREVQEQAERFAREHPDDD